MSQKAITQTSKFLSFVLRHKPDAIGLELDAAGWANIADLIAQAAGVDLGLLPQTPPPVLFHGTATRFLDSILATGLEPRGRQHVHLSADEETAISVGRRHGKPVVLKVDAAEMVGDGHAFFLSKNEVWLALAVPPRYLKLGEST